jgi:type VI protein secretion system component VasF
MSYQSNDQFFQALRAVIDGWCEHRNLVALSHILPAYLGFNGLTDGWGELDKALRNLRSACYDDLTTQEQNTLHDLIAATDSVLYKR